MAEKNTLFQLAADMAILEDELYMNGGELTEELALTLPQTSDALVAKVDSIGCLIRKFESSVDSIDAEIKRLQALKKTCNNAADNLKGYVLHSMDNSGFERLDGSLTKFYRRRSERTITDDETILAPYQFAIEQFRQTLPEYVTLPDFKVNKTIIKDMIKKQGIQMAGAHLEENWSVVMK
jgi:hypothetical protein